MLRKLKLLIDLRTLGVVERRAFEDVIRADWDQSWNDNR